MFIPATAGGPVAVVNDGDGAHAGEVGDVLVNQLHNRSDNDINRLYSADDDSVNEQTLVLGWSHHHHRPSIFYLFLSLTLTFTTLV